jgi:hypothetical protein
VLLGACLVYSQLELLICALFITLAETAASEVGRSVPVIGR